MPAACRDLPDPASSGRPPAMNSTRFPRTARVRARSDFDRIFKHGRRVALPVLALHFQADDSIAP
ncbi:hypothetical protein AB4084_21105, partial [Lysobacter sp. 2RAB21]